MRKLPALALALALGGLTAAVAYAETLNLSDGSTVEGEVVSANEQGLIVRLADGGYSPRVTWDKIAQEDLKRLAKNAKYARFTEGLIIEDDPPEKKRAARPPLVVREVENRLERPENPALIGGLLGSALGWLVVLALYGANLWAAYEIAIFRAQPVGLVCGLAAVVPVIPQIVYLSLPTRMPKSEETAEAEAAAAAAITAETEQKIGASLKIVQEEKASQETPKTVEPAIFKRGEFMFNRRFFETRFTNFFTLVRRDKDKGTSLVIKTSRGTYTANRISRISANEMHLEVAKGAASEEIGIPFVEIQEVQLRPGGSH